MGFLIWPAMRGSGVQIYIIINPILLMLKMRCALIPQVLPHHWTLMNPICPSALCVAALFYAMTAIVADTVFPDGCVRARIRGLVIPASDVLSLWGKMKRFLYLFSFLFAMIAHILAAENKKGDQEDNERMEWWRESMYYHYYKYPQGWHFVKKHYGIRTARYKLIHFYADIVAREFYDLQKDPHEINNIYDDPAYTKIIKNTRQELMRLRQEFGDTN
jgi:hypothetical protein